MRALNGHRLQGKNEAYSFVKRRVLSDSLSVCLEHPCIAVQIQRQCYSSLHKVREDLEKTRQVDSFAMVNPGAFRGARKTFLLNEKPAYADGVSGGYIADVLADIQRRFFKRFPVDLPVEYEPSVEDLEAVDDNAPEPEAVEPDSGKMSAQEFEAAIEKTKERQKVLRFRKAQIKRWFHYQHMKDQDADSKDSTGDYNAMIFKLTGKEVGQPRRKTPANLWRKTQQAQINAKARAIGKEQALGKEQMAALRDKIARDMFNALDPKVKEHWKKQVEIEYEQASNEWKRSLNSEGPKDASYRQNCIYNVVQVAQGFLDWLCDNTGWKASLITGGPEPAHGGRLNIISVHSGYTLGDVKMNFGRAERARYKEFWVPIFGDFLKKCYTTEECRALALKVDTGFHPLSEQELESGGCNMDRVDMPGFVDEEDVPLTPSGAPIISDSAAKSADTAPATGAGVTSPPTPPADSGGTVIPPDSPEDIGTEEDSPAVERDGTEATSNLTEKAGSEELVEQENSRAPEDLEMGREEHVEQESSGASKDLETEEEEHVEEENSGARKDLQIEQERELQVPANPSSEDGPSARNSPPLASDSSRRQPSPAGSVLPTPQASPRNTPPPSGRGPLDSPSRTVTSENLAGLALALSANDTVSQDSPSGKDANPTAEAMDQAISEPQNGRVRQKRRSDASDSSQESDERPTKRVRTRLQTASTPEICVPPDAPKWFATTLSMLQGTDLGPSWSRLLNAWTTFEIHHEFQEVRNLPARYRPSCIHEWIQRARSPHFRPLIQDLEQFAQSFANWWLTLQPKWRISDEGDLLHERVDGDLEVLRRPGVNGLHSAVAGLFFWGLSVKGKVDDRTEWLRIVDDMMSICKALVSSTPP